VNSGRKADSQLRWFSTPVGQRRERFHATVAKYFIKRALCFLVALMMIGSPQDGWLLECGWKRLATCDKV
jgi:hypothetical protein